MHAALVQPQPTVTSVLVQTLVQTTPVVQSTPSRANHNPVVQTTCSPANPRANRPQSCKPPPLCSPSCKAPRDPGELLVLTALVQPQPTVTSILVQTLVQTTPAVQITPQSCNPPCRPPPLVQSTCSRATPRAKHHVTLVSSLCTQPSCNHSPP